MVWIGFGTMNGKDGKPFKTRAGNVMRLEVLIQDTTREMYKKITDNRNLSKEEAEETAKIIALSALKYGDLSNQAAKDYIFDLDRFTSFEGNTGPYILYTIVRIKSILRKYEEEGNALQSFRMREAKSMEEKDLQKGLAGFSAMLQGACEELAPHKICAYIYELSNAFNSFYHKTPVLSETDLDKKQGYLAELVLTKKILETGIDLLGFSAPERM